MPLENKDRQPEMHVCGRILRLSTSHEAIPCGKLLSTDFSLVWDSELERRQPLPSEYIVRACDDVVDQLIVQGINQYHARSLGCMQASNCVPYYAQMMPYPHINPLLMASSAAAADSEQARSYLQQFQHQKSSDNGQRTESKRSLARKSWNAAQAWS